MVDLARMGLEKQPPPTPILQAPAHRLWAHLLIPWFTEQTH